MASTGSQVDVRESRQLKTRSAGKIGARRRAVELWMSAPGREKKILILGALHWSDLDDSVLVALSLFPPLAPVTVFLSSSVDEVITLPVYLAAAASMAVRYLRLPAEGDPMEGRIPLSTSRTGRVRTARHPVEVK